MRVSNNVSNLAYLNKFNNLAAKKPAAAAFAGFKGGDTVSFGSGGSSGSSGAPSGGAPTPPLAPAPAPAPAPSRGKGKMIFKGVGAIATVFAFAVTGVQGYNAGTAILAQRQLNENFKNNPKNVAVDFMDEYLSSDSVFGDGTVHIEYSEGGIKDLFAIKDWNGTILGPDSTVTLDFDGSTFTSVSLDIDGDKNAEITVTPGKDGEMKIVYDFDSNGEADTVEIFNPSENGLRN